MTARKWIDQLFSRSHKVDYVFFVSERDKGDYQPIYDTEQVCKDVSKYVGHNVDYDFIFKQAP